jgi:ATP-dependent DNA ligase
MWVYEPKWDGFRALVAHLSEGTRVLSRRGRELGPHYPELLRLGSLLPPGSVLDGEIVAFVEGGLDFGALQFRLTMRDRKAREAAADRPVSFVAFDLLRLVGEDLTPLPLSERRRRLEQLVGSLGARPLIDITPQTDDRELASRWLLGYMAAGIDGVVAKRGPDGYRPGERAWVKVKGERTVEAVVRGYIGSALRPRLVLGLYSGMAPSTRSDRLIRCVSGRPSPWAGWRRWRRTHSTRSCTAGRARASRAGRSCRLSSWSRSR